MTSLFASRIAKTSLAALCSLAVATLAGCGIGIPAADSTSSTYVGGLHGTVFGGPNPITGAALYLYATDTTGTTGYGAGATQIERTVTTASGQFKFPTAVTSAGGTPNCPAGSFVYMISEGGNTGANAANNNSVMLAALGPCVGFDNTRPILINELTTVVAAYTLANFMTVTGTPGPSTTTNAGVTTANSTPAFRSQHRRAFHQRCIPGLRE